MNFERQTSRYATKMVLYDGAILLLSMAVVAIVYALMV